MSSSVSMLAHAAALFAGALIWLMLSDPVTVADAVETGEVLPLVTELANAIYQALLSLLDYL